MARRIAIVPARAGSVRLPAKNLKLVGGVSLVERSVRHARAAGAEIVVVSTDDEAVKTLFEGESGLVVVDRPPHLASSSASMDGVIQHVIESLQVEDDAVVLILQPTSPFRPRSLLEECVSSVVNSPDCLTLTVTRSAKVAGWAYCMRGGGLLSSMPPSCDPVGPTGAVYAFRCGAFMALGTLDAMEKVGVLSDLAHSCDIDEEYELVIAVALANAGFGDDVVDRRITSRPENHL